MGTMHLEFLEKVDLRRVFLVSAPSFTRNESYYRRREASLNER